MVRIPVINPRRRNAAQLLTMTIIALLLIPIPLSIGNAQSMVIDNKSEDVTLASLVYASDRAREVYESVSVSSYTNFVREFSEIGPKLYGTSGNEDTREWILDRLYNVTDGKVVGQVIGHYDNVLGRLRGSMGGSGPVVLIGAHYDTVEVSPGANDDGSGVATTLELARVLSQYSWPVDIYFGFWNAEESGLHGSAETAANWTANEIDLLIHYNIDMLLVPLATAPTDKKINMAYLSGSGASFHDSQYWA